MSEDNLDFIIDTLEKLFPDAKCELNYHNIYELSVAVILSAQTTDKSVNRVTPNLFKKYPNIESLANAKGEDVRKLISSIGLSNRKSEYIIKFSQEVMDKFQGVIPSTIEELVTISGVGRKTANVIVSEGIKSYGLAVDTHVLRVSNRLGLVDSSDPIIVEDELKRMFDKELWHALHHRFIFMGRYLCHSKNPECERCPFINICRYKNPKN